MKKTHFKNVAACIGAALCVSSAVSAAMAPMNSAQPVPVTAQGVPDASLIGADSMATRDSLTAGNQKFNDAEILRWELVVDSNEVAAASLAEKKKIGHDAMAYAKMLRKEHAADGKKTAKLAKKLKLVPVSNKETDDLRAEGAAGYAALSAKNGAEFETAYIDAMIKGHTDALQTLDTKALPNAVDAATKKHLGELREHIAMHLEHAKRLQNTQASVGGE